MYSHNLLMNYNIDDKTLQLADQCKLNIAWMELSRLPHMLQPDYFPVRPTRYNLVTCNNILTLYEIPEYQPISLKMFQQLSDFKLPNVYGVEEKDMMEVLMLVYRNHPKMIELAEKLGWIRKRVVLTVNDNMIFVIRDGNGDYLSSEYHPNAFICIRYQS